MQISAQWLIIVCLLAIIPALLAVLYIIIIRNALQGAINMLQYDNKMLTERLTNMNTQWTDINGDFVALEHKVSDCNIAVHSVEQKLVNTDESFRALSNKLAARERTERRAAKRDEEDLPIEPDQIPVEQLELFNRLQQQQNQFPPVNQPPAGGAKRIIHP
jgi:chromosome segregation ATPase